MSGATKQRVTTWQGTDSMMPSCVTAMKDKILTLLRRSFRKNWRKNMTWSFVFIEEISRLVGTSNGTSWMPYGTVTAPLSSCHRIISTVCGAWRNSRIVTWKTWRIRRLNCLLYWCSQQTHWTSQTNTFKASLLRKHIWKERTPSYLGKCQSTWSGWNKWN